MIYILKAVRELTGKSGFRQKFVFGCILGHLHWVGIIKVLTCCPWIWTILPPHTKKSALISSASSFASWPINKKFIITTDSTSISSLIKNIIHQIIMLPFSINLWLHVIRNNVFRILLQGFIWEQIIVYTSIKYWFRIPDTDHITNIILWVTYTYLITYVHCPRSEALQNWCIHCISQNHQPRA